MAADSTVEQPPEVRQPKILAGRLAYLDGWRGLAILTVLTAHFLSSDYVGPVFSAGALGVEIFFVLSGRLMAQILVLDRFPLPDFFVRRFSRIYPAMLVYALVILAIVLLAHRFAPKLSIGSPLDFLAAITFTINYRIALFGAGDAYLHLWSICVEEHCYALLALICIFTRRQRLLTAGIVAFIAALAMANGLRLFLQHAGGVHEIYWRTDVRLASVFASFAIFLFTRRPLPLPTVSLALCVVIATVISITPTLLPLRYTVATLLLAYGVSLLDQIQPAVQRFLSSNILTHIGVWSYSIYIWQQPFSMFRHHAGLMMLPAAVAMGLVSFYLVETPARRWLNANWRRFQPKTA
jgi:peptidoglycan/LPS O-acetylase OafA/YrhL